MPGAGRRHAHLAETAAREGVSLNALVNAALAKTVGAASAGMHVLGNQSSSSTVPLSKS